MSPHSKSFAPIRAIRVKAFPYPRPSARIRGSRLGRMFFLIQRLAVAFDANGQHHDQKKRNRPQIGRDINQAVAFQ